MSRLRHIDPHVGEGFLEAVFGGTADSEDRWGMPLTEEWVVRVWQSLGRIRLDLCKHPLTLTLVSAILYKPIVRLSLMETLNLRLVKLIRHLGAL